MVEAVPIDGNFVAQLIQDTETLFSDILRETQAGDDRARKQRVDWPARHRLHVLLEAAKETAGRLPSGIFAPWFIAELMATNQVVHKWIDTAAWKEVRGALVNPTDFTHTILTLQLAERFQLEGHNVELVPRQRNATPDLRFSAIGGTQDWVYVECKLPRILDGRDLFLSEGRAKRTVNKALSKAKPQLGETVPGILAICSYSQPSRNLAALNRATEARLKFSSRLNLVGVILFSQGVLFKEVQGQYSFTPIVKVSFVHNPNYFGRVDMKVSTPAEDSTLVREPLVDVTIRRQPFGARIDYGVITQEQTTLADESTSRATNSKVLELSLVADFPKNRAIVERQDRSVSPLFSGDGDVNFICVKCHAIIAERVWKLSITNLVAKCPSCHSFLEFPIFKHPSLPLIGTIGIKPGRYPLSESIHVRRGVIVTGV